MEKISKQVLSLPVLSINEGEQLGFIKEVVIDPVKKEIAALIVNQKGWFKEDRIIPFNRVSSIGDNAIIIDKSTTAEKPANLPQIVKLIKNPTTLINSKVVTASGKSLGQIEEYWFDSTGKITKFEISGRMLEGIWKGKASLLVQEVVTMGKEVVLVAEGAEKRLVPTEKQRQKTMKDLKAATSKAWDTTVQASQKLGHAIAHSISKLAEEEEKISKEAAEKPAENSEEPAEALQEPANPPAEEIPDPGTKEPETYEPKTKEPKE